MDVVGAASILAVVSNVGVHSYVPPLADGVAVRVVNSPSQIEVAPPMETLGADPTVTLLVSKLLVHPKSEYSTE